VREEMKTASYTDSYRKYLEIRGQALEDPVRVDVQRRTANK
jgi:hypothetical protein